MKVATLSKKRSDWTRIFLLTAALLLSLTSNANVVIKRNAASIEPTRSVEVSNNVITVTYDFSEISEIVDESGSIRHSIPGFGFCYEEGFPQVPMRIDTFKIPEGYDISVSSSRSNSQQIECNYTLATGLDDYKADGNTKSQQAVTIAVNELFPPQIAQLHNNYSFRGEKLVEVKVYPIQFDPRNNLASFSDKISYSLTLMPEGVQTYGMLKDGENSKTYSDLTPQLEDCLVNNINEVGNILTSDTFGFEGTVGYIIVTTDEYLDYAGEFAKWKKYLGYSPYIISKENWTDWTEVRNEIISCVKSHQNVQYLLILGDSDDVPSRKNCVWQTLEHFTDAYYANTNEEQYIPELLMGRICVDNTIEARNILHKLMRHEMCPIISEDFYSNAAQCGYFETAGTIWHEGRRFILTSEEIRNYVAKQGVMAHRYYTADSESDPAFYSDYYGNGKDYIIPEEIQKPNFNWDCNAQEIADRINEGALYTMYRGHGEYFGWCNPESDHNAYPAGKLLFGTSNLHLLKNFEYPTTIFSITCQTGKFANELSDDSYPDCFAEAILKKEFGGASAVIAASDNARSGQDDTLAESLIDAIWPNPGLRPRFAYNPTGTLSKSLNPCLRLGQILSQAKFKMKEQWGDDESCIQHHYEIFHLFGDPSMYFHTKNPTPIKNVQIYRYANSVIVTTDEDQISIGFYDKAADKMCKFENSCATFYSENPQDVIVCLTGHNKLTYLDGTEIPVPAIEELELPEVSCQWINNSTVGIKVHTSQLRSDYIVTISDLNGRTLFRNKLDNTLLNNSVMVPFSYANGVYIVTMEENGRTILTKKLIKK